MNTPDNYLGLVLGASSRLVGLQKDIFLWEEWNFVQEYTIKHYDLSIMNVADSVEVIICLAVIN